MDFLSGGRFLFGIGGGWNEEEMENHGTKPSLRWKILRERVLAMKEIWTKDEAEFHGQFVNFDSIWSWPKPAAKPHPPVLMGGAGPRTLDRVLEYADEWMPIGGRSGAVLGQMIEALQARAKAAGRGVEGPPISCIPHARLSEAAMAKARRILEILRLRPAPAFAHCGTALRMTALSGGSALSCRAWHSGLVPTHASHAFRR